MSWRFEGSSEHAQASSLKLPISSSFTIDFQLEWNPAFELLFSSISNQNMWLFSPEEKCNAGETKKYLDIIFFDERRKKCGSQYGCAQLSA